MLPKAPLMTRGGTPNQPAERTARPRRASTSERSYSEENITPEMSLTVSAVLAAFTILCEDLSSLPLILYQRLGRVKIRAYQNIYYKLMHDRPNPEHSSMQFREFIEGHMLGWGNFYAQLIWDKRGDIVEMWPLRPDRMTVARVDGQRVYSYYTSTGQPRTFLSDEILHIPAFGFDGLVGYSRISLARNAIGLSMSAEKFGSKLFANDTSVGVIFRHPGALSEEAFDTLQESLNDRSGSEKAHEAIILEEGMDIARLGLPPEDSQFLETRKFQVNEIARIFRIPPHMLADVEKSSSWGAGIEGQEQGYVNHTLRPWATRIEEAARLQLLPEVMQETFWYEHLMDALLRGDIKPRYEAYVQAITNGFMSPNEVRSRENMNPYKGGDVYWRPLNMEQVGANANQGGNTNARAESLDPLWRDAIARVMKREENDLHGALRRWGLKGQEKRFEAWVTQFYDQDHPAFIQKQLQPILEAEQRLFGWDRWGDVALVLVEMLNERKQQVLDGAADELVAGLDEYVTKTSAQLLEMLHPDEESGLEIEDSEIEDLRLEAE